ncbi:hypothetical protein YC2023_077059 [Brassica napus]
MEKRVMMMMMMSCALLKMRLRVFETTILQGLSDWQRKLQLKKLMMNLGTEKRKELSNEWKALCSEELN